MDSDYNIMGTKYMVLVIDPEIQPKDGPVLEYPEPTPWLLERIVFEAAYESPFRHQEALDKCFQFIQKDIIKRKDFKNGSIIELNFQEKILEKLQFKRED